MNTAETKATLLSRMEGLQHIPTIPAVLAPLLRYLEQPVEQIDVQKVTDLIAQDKSLAAQCLQMANSPLFGRWKKIDSLRGAVVGPCLSARVAGRRGRRQTSIRPLLPSLRLEP